jgi:ABC-2 type transport system permease protein
MTTAFADTQAIAGRHLRFLAREPSYLSITLMQPLVYLLLFSQLFAGVAELPGFPGSYLVFLLPGVVAMAALSTGGWAGTSPLEDIERGVMSRLLVTPSSRAAIVVGHLVQGAVLVIVEAAILVGVGLVMGARFEGGIPGMAVMVVAAILLASGAGALSHALALATRNQTALIAASQAIILPMMFLSTTFMPRDLMPDWMAVAATFNPLTWAVEASRIALEGGDAMAAALRLVALTGFAVVGVLLALVAFRGYRRAA